MDSGLNFTIQALPGIPTTFNTPSGTTQAGIHGTGSLEGSDGTDGSALGNSIFLRAASSLTFMANETNDLLTLGDEVGFVDDTIFGGGGTRVNVRGNGTVIYNGTTDYQGTVAINNANFKVNGQIDQAPVFVCRNISFSSQRGMLSGRGVLSGDVSVNSGIISPDAGETLTLGSLFLNSAEPLSGTLGSLVHVEIDSGNISSLVAVIGSVSLAGVLEIDLDPNAAHGTYIILTSSAITGTFDSITFKGDTPNYSLSYLPIENPTFVQLEIFGFPPPPPPPPPPISFILSPKNLKGKQVKKKCGKKTKIFNILKWESPTLGVRPLVYRIYRENLTNLIAVLPANGELKFKDKIHSNKSTFTYYIISEEGDQFSYPATIIIKSKDKKLLSCSSS